MLIVWTSIEMVDVEYGTRTACPRTNQSSEVEVLVEVESQLSHRRMLEAELTIIDRDSAVIERLNMTADTAGFLRGGEKHVAVGIEPRLGPRLDNRNPEGADQERLGEVESPLPDMIGSLAQEQAVGLVGLDKLKYA
ncbi:MAG TPA: hypothetical protein PKC98_18560 [Candidatus Melainabacteria bacterium]|nr:hypothetical protein [Candidatus Melainabacteria bacterium]